VIAHAGLIARRLGGRWRGVLIQGPSGSGKSDLALRALGLGFRLVADDRTLVWASDDALYGRAPPVLQGLIEARGLGLFSEPAIGFAEIVLVACAAADPRAMERLPDPAHIAIAGVTLPRLMLDFREHSAAAKLNRAMEHLGAASQRGYQADPLGGPHRAGTGDTP
jgi:serine kinase of HPr protein (carbohydrate metabolism regulator)